MVEEVTENRCVQKFTDSIFKMPKNVMRIIIFGSERFSQTLGNARDVCKELKIRFSFIFMEFWVSSVKVMKYALWSEMAIQMRIWKDTSALHSSAFIEIAAFTPPLIHLLCYIYQLFLMQIQHASVFGSIKNTEKARKLSCNWNVFPFPTFLLNFLGHSVHFCLNCPVVHATLFCFCCTFFILQAISGSNLHDSTYYKCSIVFLNALFRWAHLNWRFTNALAKGCHELRSMKNQRVQHLIFHTICYHVCLLDIDSESCCWFHSRVFEGSSSWLDFNLCNATNSGTRHLFFHNILCERQSFLSEPI